MRETFGKLLNRLYRFKTPNEMSGWRERAEHEREAFDALRRHPSFAAFQDLWDAEWRAILAKFLDSRDEKEILALHAEARALQRLIGVVEGAANLKQRGEAAESEYQRQIDLSRIDQQRRSDAVKQSLEARRAQMHTTTMSGVRS